MALDSASLLACGVPTGVGSVINTAGIKAAEKLQDKINERYPRKSRFIYLSKSLIKYRVSDPSDLLKNKGRETLTQFLKENKLII